MKNVLMVCVLLQIAMVAKAQKKIVGKDPNKKEQIDSVSADNKTGVLRFSHINYTSKFVNYNISDTLLVILKSKERGLNEVIIYNDGYQILPKERATGSFEQVSNKVLNSRASTNIMDRLESSVSGIQFDNRRSGSPNIMIRGLNSFSGGLTSPLVILDNFPYDGDLSNINPNDIATVTVLKDAAATSIWGARAGNGVIVLNSKKNLDQVESKIEAGVSYSMVEQQDLGYIQKMSSSDFIDVEKLLYDKGFYNSSLNSTSNFTAIFSPVVKLLRGVDLGEISQSEALQQIDNYRKLDYRDDLNKYFYRTGLNQQYHVSYATNSKKMTSRVSLGFDRNLNNDITNSNRRFTVKTDLIYNPNDKIQVATTLQYSNLASEQGNNIFSFPISPGGNRQELYPYAQLVDNSKKALAIPYSYNPDFLVGITDPLLDWTMKPYDDIRYSNNIYTTNHFNATLNLKYRLLNGLDMIGQYSLEKQLQRLEQVDSEDAYFTRNLINLYTTVTNDVVKFAIPHGGIKTSTNNDLISQRGRLQLNFNRTFNQHQVSVLLGTEISKNVTESLSSRVYGYDINLRTNQPVDYITLFQTYRGLGGRQSIPYLSSDGMGEKRFLSFFGNGAYTLKQRYTLSLSARRDASNLFGVKTNHRWKPLWSVGGAWTVTKENWLSGVPELNHLKLRWTYGHSGNIGGITGAYPLITYVPAPQGSQTTLPRAFISQLPNPLLKWEDIRMINYGVDFGLFDNFLSGTVEYFDKLSSDLLTNNLIDPTSGFSSTTKNIGVLSNRGFDFKLSGKLGKGNILWFPSIFLSISKNKVQEFYGNTSNASVYTTNTGRSMRPLPNKSLYPVFSLVFSGLDPLDGDPQGIYKGEVSKNYRNILRDSIQYLNYHGTALPPYTGAFRNEFTINNFSISFNISYKFGHYFQKETIRYASLFNFWNSHKDFEKRWQQTGDELQTSVPSMKYPADSNRDSFYANSEVNIEKGDIVKLQDIQLIFTPNFSKMNVLKNANLRFFFNANNVCTIWRATESGYDSDYLGIPNQRNFTIGFNLSY